MDKTKQRIAIAELCGYERLLGDPWRMLKLEAWMPLGWSIQGFMLAGEPAVYLDALPDYLHDLNAMYKAEEWLYKVSVSPINKDGLMAEWRGEMKTAWVVYMFHLSRVTNRRTGSYPTHSDDWVRIHASAEQRAEAFLKAMGKWEEDHGDS